MKAYHQVPVHPPDIPKTAVIIVTCPMASVMLLKLSSGSWIFDNIIHDLPFVFVYLDNILVASSSFSQQISNFFYNTVFYNNFLYKIFFLRLFL